MLAPLLALLPGYKGMELLPIGIDRRAIESTGPMDAMKLYRPQNRGLSSHTAAVVLENPEVHAYVA